MSTSQELPTASADGYKPGKSTMHALTYQGKRDVRVSTVDKPTITDPADIPDLEKAQILGHECVGTVEHYCKAKQFSMCDRTNKSGKTEQLYGQKLGGILGYSHLLSGYAGTQAEYFRVPFGDVNCIHLPDEVPDDIVDIGFWKARPLPSEWLIKVFGAKKVILIDNVAPRLQWAKDRLDVEDINFDHTPKVAEKAMKKIPDGVDVSFDAAGCRYSKSFLHKAIQTLSLETGAPETLNKCILATRKYGRISVIADYVGLCVGSLIGALMEKAITLKGNGQAPVQAYMEKVINEYIAPGKFGPTMILTHRFTFDHVAKAYQSFDKKRIDEAKGIPSIKAFFETKHSKPRSEGTPELGSVPGI
ncbi:probable glutathione-dependent formaldehyde dehydrogenase [Ustilago sp. UG-2017b]|nr:probable glutathione-dependent formaldehyde dehydrogenase [Ustilago sp. UG-2017b]